MLVTAISNGADTAEIHGELGELYYQDRRFRDAILEFGRAAQLAPQSAHYSLRVADALIGDGRYSVALELLDALKKSFDRRPAYHYDRGLILYQRQKYRDAAQEFTRALQLSPQMDSAEFFVANCDAAMGDLESAVPHYRRSLALNPGNAKYYLALASVLEQLTSAQQDTEALNLLKKGLELAPKDSAIEFALGVAYERRGDLANAKSLLEDVSLHFPNSLPPHVALARIYRKQHDAANLEFQEEAVRRITQLQQARNCQACDNKQQ